MKAFFEPLKEIAKFNDIYENRRKEKGILQVSGCVTSQKTHLAAALGDDSTYNLLVYSSDEKARKAYEEYRFLSDDVYLYPAKDLLFYHADIKGNYIAQRRMETISAILENDSDKNISVITTVDAFIDGISSPEEMKKHKIHIKDDSVIDLSNIETELSAMGYKREVEVNGPGQFAVRGGILDVFPLTEEVPVRVELWGDEIDSIRTFDLESQRSIENIDDILIYPASDVMAEDGDKVSFLDYFDQNKTLLFLDEPQRIYERLEEVSDEYNTSLENRIEADLKDSYEDLKVYSIKDIVKRIDSYYSIGFAVLETRCREFKIRNVESITVKGVNPYNNSFETLTKDLLKLKTKGYRVILLSGSRTRARRLAEDLRDYGLTSFYGENLNREVEPKTIMTAYGHVETGYEYPLIKYMVISETDIFGNHKKKKKRKVYEGRKIQNFSDLKPGDYVVHENHGLGIYEGIEKIEVDRVAKDYMKISYAGKSNLYLPATQLDLIQKYAGADAKKPKLSKLGSNQWIKTKNQVRGAVKEIAKDLVKLYATRQNTEGYEYGPDTIWQREFEEMFPFEETEDQIQAIEDTKRDMQSKKIMDRLVCGDVGYGKTEIAIRAAFKAVQESKQVVYLVPTTILAQQHYNTFVQRMKDFPVEIELLCRFRTPAQQKKTIENLKKGRTDIVIGTHRVLSKDVEYKDLGLLIIDEEQRFGVAHKEKIKQLKENVDVLTLTATPIPRTLHMSLIGIRDMSVLEEAPMDRMPIQTYVLEYNEEVVREAIERELSRSGQIYYVYNKVSDIADIAGRIQKMVPDAVVTYAHGQMHEHELEEIMCDFINGDIDVLVSTTIIETGLDISNANTMIIHDADKMGLSQLYQLRGRVGRSNRMAYAFLLYTPDKMLKEVAEKRLAAIREFTDLGSGFKIAMRDLEIRGAGNLLGAKQSGHMEAVGYDLYCKLLNEAVRHEKGEAEIEDFNTTIDLNVDAFIPDTYIPNVYQKLDIYKRIATIETEEDMDDMVEELIDRFGDIPKKVQMLLTIASLKALAHSAYITEVAGKGSGLKFTMYENAKVNPERIPKLIEKYKGDLVIRSDSETYFYYEKKLKTGKVKEMDVFEKVKMLLNDIKSLLD